MEATGTKITYRDQTWKLEGKRSVREAIEEVGLSRESVLALQDGKLVNQDVMLDEDEETKLIAVISGG